MLHDELNLYENCKNCENVMKLYKIKTNWPSRSYAYFIVIHAYRSSLFIYTYRFPLAYLIHNAPPCLPHS